LDTNVGLRFAPSNLRLTHPTLAATAEGYVPDFQLVGGPYLQQSPTVVQGTTVSLTQDIPMANGSVIPAGSVVTVNGDAMQVILPSGTSYIANYSKLLPVRLELFGGETGQIPGYTNVDIIATQGIKADITKGIPVRPGSVDEIVASNPYLLEGNKTIMDWLPEAVRTLKPGGRLIINGTYNNSYARLPSVTVLESMGIRVVQERGPLLPQFQGQTFRHIDGTDIPIGTVKTTIIEKVH
jgi:hypothetical protein